jgi:hypothetical protein
MWQMKENILYISFLINNIKKRCKMLRQSEEINNSMVQLLPTEILKHLTCRLFIEGYKYNTQIKYLRQFNVILCRE